MIVSSCFELFAIASRCLRIKPGKLSQRAKDIAEATFRIQRNKSFAAMKRSDRTELMPSSQGVERLQRRNRFDKYIHYL